MDADVIALKSMKSHSLAPGMIFYSRFHLRKKSMPYLKFSAEISTINKAIAADINKCTGLGKAIAIVSSVSLPFPYDV